MDVEAGLGLGGRIRMLRQRRRSSLEQLAAETGLTKSYLSKVERGIAVPSIATALKVSRAFGLTVGQLLGETPTADAFCLVRRADRVRFMAEETPEGYNYDALAPARAEKGMEPFVMRPPHEFHSNKRMAHAGEEMMFVLSGTVELEFGHATYRLDAGDCLYFDAHHPHRTRSVGPDRAEALVVVLTRD
jgi:transcriptional regulator with XRE-family HTH domain